jgi:hypothetical protein
MKNHINKRGLKPPEKLENSIDSGWLISAGK